ncbi:MAG: DNA repair protein RecO [Thiotrichales bacterium]
MKYESPGFVLHSRRFRENSRILELFTRNDGRVAVVARVSSRQAGSRLASFQPFRESLCRWQGRSSLQTLISCELQQAYRLEAEAGICGFYCNELILHLTAAGMPYPELYEVYIDTLGLLSAGQVGASTILRNFEWRLLDALGYAINPWTDCIDESELPDSGIFFFHPERGISRHSLGPQQVEFSAKTLQSLRADTLLKSSQQRELKAILGAAVRKLLGNRQLKSKLLIQSLKKYRT